MSTQTVSMTDYFNTHARRQLAGATRGGGAGWETADDREADQRHLEWYRHGEENWQRKLEADRRGESLGSTFEKWWKEGEWRNSDPSDAWLRRGATILQAATARFGVDHVSNAIGALGQPGLDMLKLVGAQTAWDHKRAQTLVRGSQPKRAHKSWYLGDPRRVEQRDVALAERRQVSLSRFAKRRLVDEVMAANGTVEVGGALSSSKSVVGHRPILVDDISTWDTNRTQSSLDLPERVDFNRYGSTIGMWHSHPSGIVGLSAADIRVTRELAEEAERRNKGNTTPEFVSIVVCPNVETDRWHDPLLTPYVFTRAQSDGRWTYSVATLYEAA